MTVLVTGATGQIGRTVVGDLLEAGVPLRLGTRHPSRASGALPPLAQAVAWDLHDGGSVAAALDGVTAAYLAAPDDDFPAEPLLAAVDAAEEAGVRRLVLLSALGVPDDAPVERRVRESGLVWTIVRPSTFMQNYTGVLGEGVRRARTVLEPAGTARTGFVDTRDIGAVAAALLRDERHAGRTLVLTGPEAIDRGQVAAAIGDAIGEPVAYRDAGPGEFSAALLDAGLPSGLVERLLGFYAAIRAGAFDVVTDAVEDVTGRPPVPFRRFAADHAAAWRRP